MNNENIKTLIIFILCIVVAYQLVKLLSRVYKKERFSNMEMMGNLSKDVDSEKQPEYEHSPLICDLPPNFYVRKNRYAYDPKCPCSQTGECKCPDGCVRCNCKNGAMGVNLNSCPCGCVGGCSCPFGCKRCKCKEGMTGPVSTGIDGIDWSVKHECGANGTCGDTLWHYTSPRMILMNNCLTCDQYGKNANYNPPNGMLNSLASEHDAGVEKSIKKVHGLIYDELTIPDFSNNCTEFAHTMSRPRNAGIVPMYCDCVKARVADSSRCGCDGFGKIYNFHA